MQKFEKGFFVGAATAAHQVEGNNIHSDYWAQEQLPHTSFTEPSGIACDHYNKYEEDIKLLADAGLNAYRFSIEWARIESMLKAAGCRMIEGAGSSVTFESSGRKMTLHRPHPGREALRYRVLAVREFLEKAGIKP